MISDKTVQLILDTARVQDVVEEYVNLRKRGANLLGLCPFHNEKTPSFTVSPAKNIYKCFGCGKGGNAVQFLMEHDTMSFPEALRFLAQKYNIEIEETQKSDAYIQEKQRKESLYLVNQFAEEYFKNELISTDEGKSVGMSYFKDRGYLLDTIEKFGLGYCSSAPDKLTKAAIAKGYTLESLKELRLTNNYDKDFFRERVMFTIRNLSGKPIAFAGRTLKTDKKIAKYVNSPESELYIKSRVLYGIYLAKKAIRKLDECLLVEGYTDVISLHQSGFENVVASSGTSLTEDQVRLIKRFTQNLKILYDGDAAGMKAADRGLNIALEQDMNVKVVSLPPGEDPDSQVRKFGSAGFTDFLEKEASDFILFKTKLLLETTKNDPIAKSNGISNIVATIALIPDAMKRAVYIKECAQLLGLDESVFIDSTNSALKKNVQKKFTERRNQERREAREADRAPSTEQNEANQKEPSSKSRKRTGKDEYKEKDIVRILINAGHKPFSEEEPDVSIAAFVLSNISDVLENFDNPKYEKFIKEYQIAFDNGKHDKLQYFINHKDKDVRDLAIDLSSSPFEYSHNWKDRHDIMLRTQPDPEDNFMEDAIQSVKYFKYSKINKKIEDNKKELSNLGPEDSNRLTYCLKLHQKLMVIRNELAQQLNIVLMD